MIFLNIILFTSFYKLIEAKYVNIVQDWWESALFYQIYVRSFMDSDGDGIGDINGVTSRLEYLKELGVDAVILSPIFKSPLRDFGFDVADYYTIQGEYGSPDDFEHLIKKAGALAIKVLLDFIPNHTSNESEWFTKSVARDEYYADWYVWEKGHVAEGDQKRPPNNWLNNHKKSAWFYSGQRDQYYLHQFGDCQPDLNYRNPVVVDEIKSIIKFWLEKGVSGLRMQGVNHLFEVEKDNFGGRYPDEPSTGKSSNDLKHIYTKDLDEDYDMVAQWREVFESISVRDNITRILITSAKTGIKNAVRYYGDNLHDGAHFPINFGIVEDLDEDVDARDLKFIVDRWLTYKPLNKPANWILGTYDKSRVASRFRRELVDAFNMLILLLPGAAVAYMGEEIGMINGFVSWSDTKDPIACQTDDPVNYVKVSRDPARTPFQWSSSKFAGFSNRKSWLPLADGYELNNVDTQRSSVRSHYQIYRTLIGLRRRPAFKVGQFISFALNDDVFAFKRWYNDDTYVVIMNVGKTYRVVNLTSFDLVFGTLEVEASSLLSTRTYTDNVPATRLDLAADEALVLRMQI